MPREIETRIEGTPKPFPKIPADSYRKMAARFDRNPGEFVMRTIIEMQNLGEDLLLDEINAIWEEEKQNDDVLRSSLIMWRILQETEPNLPTAAVNPDVKFKPNDPSMYRRENPHVMEGLRRINMKPGGSVRVRAAMLVYQSKRSGYLHPKE